MQDRAQMEFDGNIEFEVEVRATQAASLKDIRLEIPLARDVARYMMGLGVKGGRRPAAFDWTWDVAEEPGLGVDRRRQRRTAVHAEGRQVLAAAQHELLPVEAARHARLVVERRARRLPDRASAARRCSSSATAARARMKKDEVQRYDFRLLRHAVPHRSTRRRSSPPATSTPTSRWPRRRRRAPTRSTSTTPTRSTRTSTTRSCARRR